MNIKYFGLIIMSLFLVQIGLAAEKKAKKAAEPAPAAEPARAKSFSRPYGLAGCGLGSIVMGKQGSQIFAATTNETFGSQTFGITFGTLNCVDNPDNEVAHRMDTYIVANKVALASDIAKGNGETLASLSSILGCSNDHTLGLALQKNFRVIYPHERIEANEVTDSIITVIKNESPLSTGCKNLKS